MPETAMAGHSSAAPRTLRPVSLLKRAVFGLMTLVIGIMVGAWLLHASIQSTDASQTAQGVGSMSSAQQVATTPQ